MLARQLLLERASGLPVPAMLERMGSLQAQYAPSMYVGLWSRLAGLERDDVTRALERREAVQGTLQRGTIHLVSAGDYWPFALAVREARRAWWRRARPDAPPPAAMAASARRIRGALEDGPLRAERLAELVGTERAAGVGFWLDLVRVPPSGTWERRRANLLQAAETWVGPPSVRPDEALAVMLRRYLAGYGPASRQAIATWTGVPVRSLAAALAGLPLRRFRDEAGGELLDVDGAPLPPADTPAPVRFLPTYDATLLAHGRGTGILPERYRARIFHTRLPQSIPTFLVDGSVAGTWRYQDGRIALDPFEPLDAAVRRELGEEAERLAAFHA